MTKPNKHTSDEEVQQRLDQDWKADTRAAALSDDFHDVVSNASEARLNTQQVVLYSATIDEFVGWMKQRGKDPSNHIGLSTRCTRNYARRLDQLYRYVWTALEDGIVLQLTHEHADQINHDLMTDVISKQTGDPYSKTSKRKFNDTLRKLFEYRADTGHGSKWSPPTKFHDSSHRPADPFSIEERKILRNISIEYDTIPSYSDCSPSQRSQLKAYLAQKLGKPTEKVTPEDWQHHNESWEIPSLIWVSLDAGLRPIEIERGQVTWARPTKATLAIPKDQSAKGRENWEPALTEMTAEIMDRWLAEREHLERYEDTDQLWLTRFANPWGSNSLNDLLWRLLAETDIETANRKISWYSIRHSVGQYMTEEGDLSEAKEQLRHKSIETTEKYRHPSPESRRDTLDQMG